MVVEEAEGCLPEDVGGQALLSVLVLGGLLPVERGELQDPTHGPAGQEAEEVAEIGPGLDIVELAAREQGDEGGVDLGASSVPTNNQFFLLCRALHKRNYAESPVMRSVVARRACSAATSGARVGPVELTS
jgi:hypothetical protein